MPTAAITKLEAINEILSSIGSAPVNSLSSNVTRDVSMAINILDNTSRDVQSQGWSFNTEYNVKYYPDSSGNIFIDTDVLFADDVDNIGVVARGVQLYDTVNNTYIFSGPVSLNIVRYLDFEKLPQVARAYIAARAATIFQDRVQGSGIQHNFLKAKELDVYKKLLIAEGLSSDANMIYDSPDSAEIVNRGR